MTYIDLINRFWRCDEHYSFNCVETRLYFYLLKVANVLGWNEMFVHADDKTAANVGVDTRVMKNARNRLAQANLIEFERGGKGYGDRTKYRVVVIREEIGLQNMLPNPLPKTLPKTYPNSYPKTLPTLKKDVDEDVDKEKILSPNVESTEIPLSLEFPPPVETPQPEPPPPEAEKPKRRKKPPDTTSPLFDDAGFAAAWALWEQHRRDIRHPLKETTIDLQLRSLEKLGVERAVETLTHSVKQGYQGLFEPKGGTHAANRSTKRPEPTLDDIARQSSESDRINAEFRAARMGRSGMA